MGNGSTSTACIVKVLHIIVGLNTGGAELMLKRLVESHLASNDYRHTVISLTSIGKVGVQLQDIGMKVHALGMRSILDSPRATWRLARLIRILRPDVVQTWMYHADLLGGLAARLAGNRNVIWGIRTTDIKAGGSRATAAVRTMCAWLSRSVPSTIICAAEASRRAHIALGYDGSRMVVVPNGFDLVRLVATAAEREALRLQCDLGAGVVAIGYLGRFHPDKDQENFVLAAGLVAHKHSNARFLMVGSGLDANNAQLAEWIRATGFADRFVLLGERSDVPVCLAAMDLFCLSSRTEGFPNVVGEAMAMGLPCVVTDVGDAAILVADTGVVVPKEDSAALARGLGQMLAMTPAARQQLGLKAKARIHAEFTMERARERFESIYQQITRKENGNMKVMSSLKKNVPWWARIGVKIMLARLPVPYSMWKRLRLFEHGDMNQPQRAFDTMIEHARSAGVIDSDSVLPRLAGNGRDFSVLELGPGDSLFTAVIAKALGASRTWLADAGPFATKDMKAFDGIFNFLHQKGFALPFANDPKTLDDVLRECNGEYLTEGVQSLAQLPAASIDFCFSNAVLEHIPKEDFTKLADELMRILKPDGVCLHRVDLKDHLGGGLNNLRFSEATWEGALFRKSGFYTNRIRFGQMVNVFERAGFEYSLPRVLRWGSLPIPRTKLDAAFRQLTEDDLLVSGFDIVLKRKKEIA